MSQEEGEDTGYGSDASYEYYEGDDGDDDGPPCSPSSGPNLSMSSDSVTCMTRQDVEAGLNAQFVQTAETLGLPLPVASLLLRECKFNSSALAEQYFADTAAMLAKHKLSASPCVLTRGDAAAVQSCEVCCEDKPGSAFVHMGPGCEHWYCADCYAMSLGVRIGEGEVYSLKCMQPDCNRLASASFLAALLPTELQEKISTFRLNAFVTDHQSLAFCPNTLCSHVLQFPEYQPELEVLCECGTKFCVGCSEEGHAPASCRCVKDWKSKDADESMTATWIKCNTKDCPKCGSSIEKNGGW